MLDEQLIVNETFVSVQGESTLMGRLCFFIRLAGCGARCAFCDTEYAKVPDAGEALTVSALTRMAKASAVNLVEVTGGEPLEQPATSSLCAALLREKFEVMLETNGAWDITVLPQGVRRIMDVKCPSSGEADNAFVSNYAALNPFDEVKFVIADREDYDFANRVIQEHQLLTRTPNILFSAVWGRLSLKTLAEWMIADRSPARAQPQLHKIIWGPDTKGV